MGALDSIVNVVITSTASQVNRAGFGKVLVLDYHTKWSELVREYTELADMVADGFATTDAAYLAVQALFSQSPRPPSVLVGRRQSAPTMRWAVTPVATNSKKYELTVDGQTVSYTSDGSATVAEIIAGLKTAIDALSLAITTSDQTTYLRIVANSAGAFHRVKVSDVALLGLGQDHADPGIAADIAAIQAVDDTWYGIMVTTASAAEVAGLATKVEAIEKLAIQASQDSAIITVAESTPATDCAHVVKAASRLRTAVVYHGDNGEFADAALFGRVFPLDPGSETFAYKTLSGVTPDTLTPTHVVNLKAKNCGWYATLGGVGVTQEGKVASGEWLDVIRGRDWLRTRMQERIVQLLLDNNKVPFTDEGIAQVEAEVRGQLQEGVTAGYLAADPAPTVTSPKASEVSAGNRAARKLPNVRFTATLAGAIQLVDPLQGTITA